MASTYSDLEAVHDYQQPDLEHNPMIQHQGDQYQYQYPAAPPPPPQKLWGLKPKTFWVVFGIISMVVIGAAQSHKSKSSSDSNSNSNSTPISTATNLTPSLTTTPVVGPSATLLRDCPSSNNTLYTVSPSASNPQIFRKNLWRDYEYEYEQQPPSTPRGPGEGLQSITDRNYPRPNTSTKPYTTTKTDVAEDITSSRSQTSLGPAPDPFSSSGSSVPPYLSTGTPYIAGIHSSAAPYVSSPEIEQSDASPSTGWQNHIRTSDPATDREEFDPHYKVHGAWQFKWGRVFKVLWAEPTGVDGMGSGLSSETSSFTGREMVAKIRRFMIIKPMEGHCICLPILTYSGQGVRKRGVHAQHHAIIYSGKKPVAFRGEKEKGLEMRSIKFSPDNPRYRLDDASRLNYAKIYTVEYNARVWFIGKIHADSEWQVRTDYNRVNPPLEIKGSRPSGTAVDDASEHQRGAEYGSASMGSGKPNRGSSTTSLSFGSRPVVQEHLVNVVRQDAELRALCDQAIHGSGWGHFEKNLRRCLVQLSKEIRNEMQSRQATQAARAIRTFARSAAQSIKGALELQKSTKETSELKAEMYDLSTQVDPNSESSHGDETDAIDELEEDHMAEFKYFEDLVVSSKSFEWFKERFHLCVNLDQARSAVFQQWPRLSPKSPRLSPKSSHLSLLSPKSSQQSLFYDIECDLEFFIDTHVKDPTQIGNLIVITGEAVHAEALSCREYLSRACPDISTLLLKSIELLSLHKSNLCIQNEEAKLEIIRTEAVADSHCCILDVCLLSKLTACGDHDVFGISQRSRIDANEWYINYNTPGCTPPAVCKILLAFTVP
ncbi:hypothetical protein F5882DRAFT_522842 [Hyaloscypha sp. PMI_1271]|nr:hypothetical protein F5882DRAFT_522842 [Hyaloscypha sp. PMI_1271]